MKSTYVKPLASNVGVKGAFRRRKEKTEARWVRKRVGKTGGIVLEMYMLLVRHVKTCNHPSLEKPQEKRV